MKTLATRHQEADHPRDSEPNGPNAVTADTIEAIQLYQHQKRPAWGLAIFVRERDGRHDVQFQDGQMRSIAGDFIELLEPVDRPADETNAALRELTAMSGMALARNQRDRESDTRTVTLDEQVDWFLGQHADGFDDDLWVKKVRGTGQGRRAKAHRDAAIAEAQKLLAKEELDRLQTEMRSDEVVTRALRVVSATTLVSKAQLRPLEDLDLELHAPFARALRDLLYGEQNLELRLVRLMQVFRTSPTPLSWAVATVWLALVDPTEHVCIRPNIFGEQARWMAPLLRVPNRPDGRIYLRLRDMALTLQEELRQRGLTPRDLVDVYDFIWCTLRPAALKAILAQPPAPQVSQTRLASPAPKKTDGSADVT
ncbi:MAG: hypothetical protein JRI68_08680 [Deltaproteobacteria bacterium]|nr:hypothetical protein [Deltaproteobacteria bacterium]